MQKSAKADGEEESRAVRAGKGFERLSGRLTGGALKTRD
jgi:hypothetical protein